MLYLYNVLYNILADPVIEASLKNAPENVNFVKITVGNREV